MIRLDENKKRKSRINPQALNPKKDRNLFYIIFAIIFAYIVFNLDDVLSWILSIAALAKPFYIALVIAFIMNIPMCGFENIIRRLCKKIKKAVPKKSTLRLIAIIATLASLFLIIILFTTFIVPRIGDSLTLIFSNLDGYAKRLAKFLSKISTHLHLKKRFTTDSIMTFFNSINLNSILASLGDLIGADSNSSAKSIINALSGTALTTVTAIFMSIYLLYNKEQHIAQFRKFLCWILGTGSAVKVLEIVNEGTHYFHSFITGQVLEATVFMSEIYLVCKIFSFPFAELIAVCAFLFSFIPMFGSFLTLCIGTILVAAANSSKVIMFIIVFVCTQQLEGNFIYPKIVGKKVGIGGLYVLIGITFFGNLWGVIGVIAGVPIMALLYATFSRAINLALYRRGVEVSYEHIITYDDNDNQKTIL